MKIEDKFEFLTSTRSLPFKFGKEKRISVKVIDHRGNEVMVVRELEWIIPTPELTPLTLKQSYRTRGEITEAGEKF